MIEQVATIGDKLNLRRVYSENRKDDRVYVSKLLDLDDENRASIAMPLDKGKVVLLKVGDIYEIVIYNTKGLYISKAKVVDRFKTRKMFVVVVEFITNPKKLQRREYYRFDCVLDIKYSVLPEEEWNCMDKMKRLERTMNISEEERNNKVRELSIILSSLQKSHKEAEYRSGTVTDISGGGIKFSSSEPLTQKSILKMEFSNSNGALGNMRLYGKVIKSQRMDMHTDLFENRIQFLHINNDQRERIIRYIFEEERRIRRKEKGLV